MIFVTTNMEKMPVVCAKCMFYMSATFWPQRIVPQSCRARYENGIEPMCLKGIKVTKERPRWCPLVEID